MRVTVVTYLPSPYQVELFDAVACAGSLELEVVYLHWTSGTPIARHWTSGVPQHRHIKLDEGSGAHARAQEAVETADLVVFNYYQHPAIPAWMTYCERRGTPWCFWGERTGYTRLALLGRAYRHFKLAALRKSRAAIWGIGQLAVEQYRAVYGSERAYFNIPYFSDLRRFSDTAATERRDHAATRFLFSGALIARKGVDLLARAFQKVQKEMSDVHLSVLGAGEMQHSLQARLASCGDRVTFLGFQPWEDLPLYYAKADVLVAPSRRDGWALVIPEAMAAGLPVISTWTTGAAHEFIRNGHNGWVINPNDVIHLAEAMRQAARLSKEELQKFGAAAQAAVAHHQLGDGVRRFTDAVRGSVDGFPG